jgi:periplasmic divalent cation tolerance protein
MRGSLLFVYNPVLRKDPVKHWENRKNLMTDKIVVLCTCASEIDARRIAKEIVEKRLAACVNLLPPIQSIYHWKDAMGKGVIEEGEEILMIIKTARPLFEQLRAELGRLHSYEVPEIVALPIVDGSASYLGWMDRELARTEPE